MQTLIALAMLSGRSRLCQGRRAHRGTGGAGRLLRHAGQRRRRQVGQGVERDGKAARMRPLELDDFGRVKNWPEDFFGNALGETREQARLMFMRQQENKV